jgi:hypothetical protein
VGVPYPSLSETDSEGTVFNTAAPPFWCCASGSFRTVTVPCESPVKIFYLVLLIATKESRSI